MNRKSAISLLLVFVGIGCQQRDPSPVPGMEKTKPGTFIGTFKPSFFTYIDQEQPQVLRTILKDNEVSLIANNPQTREEFLSFVNELDARNIEVVVTIRFQHKQVNEEDRVIYSQEELNQFMDDLSVFLSTANSKVDYIQALNEPFGIGRYNSTLDSLAAIHSLEAAEQMVLAWMDTVVHRFKKLIDNENDHVQLLTPSVQAKGLEAVGNNQSHLWTYKVTEKIFEIGNRYCDGINFHWYPESYASMVELMAVAETSEILQTNPTIYKTCTEWSQAHEVRDILQQDSQHWQEALADHCGTSDPQLESDYLALINGLPVDHTDTYNMYRLMNDHHYRFATYFAMVQDFYTCGEVANSWYALTCLYATRFTANKIPNGRFYEEYQRIREFVD